MTMDVSLQQRICACSYGCAHTAMNVRLQLWMSAYSYRCAHTATDVSLQLRMYAYSYGCAHTAMDVRLATSADFSDIISRNSRPVVLEMQHLKPINDY